MVHQIFDRQMRRLRRARLTQTLPQHDFLHRFCAEMLLDRLADVRRTFRRVLIMGDAGGLVTAAVMDQMQPEHVVVSDLSAAVCADIQAHWPTVIPVVTDEDALPFGAETFDLILSTMALHAVNDLPGALIQLRYALQPDGLLLAAFPGGETLATLRQTLMALELETTGGVAPRLFPFVDVRDAGALLQRAGLALPVADCEPVEVTWPDALACLHDLRGMGEGNILRERHKAPLSRALVAALQGQEDFKDHFDILCLTGWAPHEDQQQPLARGSATVNLADVLNGEDEEC